jgi:DNA primase
MAGFGARVLNPEDIPKFINSPQSAVFDKGHLLYGLERARRPIRAQDQVVIVEGYLDVIALHQAGYTNTVSPMGTALTDRQLNLLKRFSRRIILALDSDAAGDKATLRGLEVARQTLDRESDPVFDARGLLRHEARLRADIRVTTLPEGMDPDDVVRRDPEEWEQIIQNAKPIVAHVMDTLSTSYDLNDPKAKDEIASQVLPLIKDIPSAIERDTYRQRLARLLRVDERALLSEPRSQAPGRRPYRAHKPPEKHRADPVVIQVASNYALESHALGVLLRRPDLLYNVDRNLQEQELSRLSKDDFQHADHQTLLGTLRDSINQDMAEPLNFVLNSLSLTMMEVADELLARTEDLDPNEDRVLGDLLRTILDLRHRHVHQNIEHLQYLMEDAQGQGDLMATQYQQSMVQHISLRHRLDKARGYYSSRISPNHKLGP